MPAAIETISRSARRQLSPQPGGHLGHLLRLDGQEDHVRLGGDQGIVGGRVGGHGVGEPLPGVLVNVRGQQPIGRRQPRLDETVGQRRGHLAGADQSDPLLQRCLCRRLT